MYPNIGFLKLVINPKNLNGLGQNFCPYSYPMVFRLVFLDGSIFQTIKQ